MPTFHYTSIWPTVAAALVWLIFPLLYSWFFLRADLHGPSRAQRAGAYLFGLGVANWASIGLWMTVSRHWPDQINVGDLNVPRVQIWATVASVLLSLAGFLIGAFWDGYQPPTVKTTEPPAPGVLPITTRPRRSRHWRARYKDPTPPGDATS